MTNMIREYRAVLENLEISQFAQLLQKARKTAQFVKSRADKRSAPQAMAVSTGKRRSKTKGREYNTPPPIPCTPKGTLELSQQEVQRNPFPNHQGKGVVAVVICADLGDDEEENPTLPAAAITTLQ